MRRQRLLILVPLGLIVVGILTYLLWPSSSDLQPATAALKDGTLISGEVTSKEYGKYIVINTKGVEHVIINWDQLKSFKESYKPAYVTFLEGFWNILPQLAVAAGLFAFFNGLWQYRDAQKWKRNEFIVKEITEYEKNQFVINAQAVLDSSGQTVQLPPKDAAGFLPFMFVDNNTLTGILSTPNPTQPLTKSEGRIRDSFDIFLSNLEKFNHYLNTGLVKQREVEFYLRYWLRIMGDKNNSKLSNDARARLWAYIRENDFPGVIELLNKFGYPV